MHVSGIEAFVHLLDQAGVPYIFGNPGTSELPLNDVLIGRERPQYVLGLQEVPVMAMADGYAMASGRVGVVNLHISPGLGNAMGMLYNAFREGTPLLVTAGQQDRRLEFEEPILGSDLVRVAKPWTKWAAEVRRVEDMPSAVRRALQLAVTPPTGPVFLSLPMDVQLERADLDLTAPATIDTRVRPPLEAVRQAASVLLSAQRPGILVGSRVLERDAVSELVTVAEALGAAVISEPGTTHGRLGFPADHPLYAQGLPLWSPEVHARLAEFDVLLVVGMDLLRQYVYHEPARAIPEHIRLVHLDEDAYQLGKNYPLTVGVLGDTKCALVDLGEALIRGQTPEGRQTAAARSEALAATHAQARHDLWQEIERQRHLRPLTPLAFMGAMANVLPRDVALIEEAVTTTNTTFERLGVLRNTSGYFGHRGWGLGWGLGVAIGAKLAWPNRPALALLGEGAAMYGIQGLWSAAKYRVPVTFVIANNAQYQILKIGAAGLDLPSAKAGKYLGLDLTGPEIDFVGLAKSLGVEARRINEPEELADAVSKSLAGDRPMLFDVPIERRVQGRLNYG